MYSQRDCKRSRPPQNAATRDTLKNNDDNDDDEEDDDDDGAQSRWFVDRIGRTVLGV